jgi:sterol desaturase/sphingolipid hydroxylase (fatty acid hydroxylase superfamily)
MTRSSPHAPIIALVLGGFGLLPFVIATISHLPGIALFHAAIPWRGYGAVILSFMGGAQWGLAVSAQSENTLTSLRRYSVSILPALAAWLSMILESRSAIMVQLAGFAMLLVYDIWTVRIREAPHWYRTLRLRLSVVVCACLLIGISEGGWS